MKALGLVVLSCAIGFGVGTCIGYAAGSAALAGRLAGILMLACGATTTLRLIFKKA